MLKAVIFDMDGVIIDSEPFHYKVNQEIYKDLGISISDDEYETFIGRSNHGMWSFIKEKYRLEHSVNELQEMQIRGNLAHLEGSNVQPIEGLMELLKELHSLKLPLGLASSSPRNYIDLVLEKLRLTCYFKAVMSGEEAAKGKPEPDIYLDTACLLGVHTSECLVIEDSQNGVLAAKRAGMLCIGFQNPSSGSQDLTMADWVVDSLMEIDLKMIAEVFENGVR